jgi:hypothetical protein
MGVPHYAAGGGGRGFGGLGGGGFGGFGGSMGQPIPAATLRSAMLHPRGLSGIAATFHYAADHEAARWKNCLVAAHPDVMLQGTLVGLWSQPNE